MLRNFQSLGLAQYKDGDWTCHRTSGPSMDADSDQSNVEAEQLRQGLQMLQAVGIILSYFHTALPIVTLSNFVL